MDAVVHQMSEISHVLTEVLQKIKQVVGSQAGHSPSHGHSSPVAPSGHLDGASVLTAHVPTPPTYPSLGRSSRPRTAGSPSFGSPFPQFGAGASTAVTSGPNFTQSGTFSSSPLVSASGLAFGNSSGGRRSSLPVGNATAPASGTGTGTDGGRRSSALDALAHLASSASPDVHRFASHMSQPIAALQDAVEQLDGGEAEAEADVLDLVAKGLIADDEARALVDLWMQECVPFCSVLDPEFDTYESLRRRSAFLFNAVVFTALRARERVAPPSKELRAASEETSRFARDQVFQTKPSLEVIQAMMVMACYHQEPYILSGVALRLALVAKLDTTVEQIEAHGWSQTDEKAQRLTAQLRTWIYIVTINAQHERNLGRMTMLLQEDVDALVSHADRALSLPFATSSDFRHVANLRLGSIVRTIIHETAALTRESPAFGDLISYVYEKKQILQDWHAHYDALICEPPSPHNRQYNDAQLGLITSVFKQQLLDPPATATFEVTQIVQEAIGHARSALHMVIHSEIYCRGTQWSGYLLRTDMSFAGIFLLKCAAAFPHLVDRNELVHEVRQTADLLSNVAGSQKYAAMLRAACNQYLEKTAPQAAAPDAVASASGPPQSSTNEQPYHQLPSTGSAPASSSLREILSTSMPAPNGPNSLLPADAGLTPLTSGLYNYNLPPPQYGDASAALMPGEMEIDWSLAVQPTLFDDSILSQHDWAASVGLAGGWQNWSA
ncbi:hypothetical protein JCM8202v2_004706 [Rhodotorula sphaerocarpa]